MSFISTVSHAFASLKPAVGKPGIYVPERTVIELRVNAVAALVFTATAAVALRGNTPILLPLIMLYAGKKLTNFFRSWETKRAQQELAQEAIKKIYEGNIPKEVMNYFVRSPSGMQQLIIGGKFFIRIKDQDDKNLLDNMVDWQSNDSEESAVNCAYSLLVNYLINTNVLTADRFMAIVEKGGQPHNRRIAKMILENENALDLSEVEQVKCFCLLDAELVPLLIENGFSINPRDEEAPLLKTILTPFPDLEKISALLRYGADIPDMDSTTIPIQNGNAISLKEYLTTIPSGRSIERLLEQAAIWRSQNRPQKLWSPIKAHPLNLLQPAIENSTTYKTCVVDRISQLACLTLFVLAVPLAVLTFPSLASTLRQTYSPFAFLALIPLLPYGLRQYSQATKILHELAIDRFNESVFPDRETTNYIVDHLPVLDRLIEKNEILFKLNNQANTLLDEVLNNHYSDRFAAFKKLIDLLAETETMDPQDKYVYLKKIVQYPDMRYLKYAVEHQDPSETKFAGHKWWITKKYMNELTPEQRSDLLIEIKNPDMVPFFVRNELFTVNDINVVFMELLSRSRGPHAALTWTADSGALLKTLLDNGANPKSVECQQIVAEYLQDLNAPTAVKTLLETYSR